MGEENGKAKETAKMARAEERRCVSGRVLQSLSILTECAITKPIH